MRDMTRAGRRRLLGVLLPLIPGAALAQGHITLSDTPVIVDNNHPEYLERFFQVNDPGIVAAVRVSIDFQAVNSPASADVGVCENPGEGNGWANEIAFRLTSPEGTHVHLVTNRSHADLGATYVGSSGVDHQTPRVQVTFEDDAEARVGTTSGGMPESGTFRPMEPLATFQGEPAEGIWRLGMQDDTHFHPLCYYGATVEIFTDEA